MSAATVEPGSRSDRTSGAGRPRTARALARQAAVLAVPALLGLALCLISLTGRSLGFDEGATVAIVSQHGGALWRGIAHDGGNMSGYYLLMHLLVGWLGDGPWVLRLPSALFAGATPGLVAAIALALWDDRRAAWIAGVLAAVSVPLVYWGQTTRGYAGMLCFACAGMLCLVRFVGAAQRTERAWRWGVAYVALTALAVYGGFIVVLIIPAQLLSLAGRPRRVLARAAVAVAGIIVLCVPIAVLAASRGSDQLFWVPRPGHQVETQVMQTLTSTGLQSTFHRVFTTTTGWIAVSAVLGALIVLAVWASSRPGDRLGGWGMRLALAWALVPGLVEFLGSFASQPVFLPRNVLVSVPAVALLLGVALADRRLPRWVALVGVALVLFIRAVPVLAAYSATPEPWREVTAEVLAAARPGDCIAFYPEDGRNAFRYYVARDGAVASSPRAVLPAVGWAVTRPFVELYPTLSTRRIASLRGACRRMWLISSHAGQPRGPAQSRHHLQRWLALRQRLRRVFRPGRLQTDGWASAIHIELFSGRPS
jgi:4-amino-4-deoxy-L-arabinose transferase-like glycosyltransferase